MHQSVKLIGAIRLLQLVISCLIGVTKETRGLSSLVGVTRVKHLSEFEPGSPERYMINKLSYPAYRQTSRPYLGLPFHFILYMPVPRTLISLIYCV